MTNLYPYRLVFARTTTDRGIETTQDWEIVRFALNMYAAANDGRALAERESTPTNRLRFRLAEYAPACIAEGCDHPRVNGSDYCEPCIREDQGC